jgi:hypothetical protein
MGSSTDARVADVRAWTRQAFALDPAVEVDVLEEAVSHGEVSQIETVIVVGRPTGPEVHRLHLPIDRVSPAHLWQLAAGDHGCCR